MKENSNIIKGHRPHCYHWQGHVKHRWYNDLKLRRKMYNQKWWEDGPKTDTVSGTLTKFVKIEFVVINTIPANLWK